MGLGLLASRARRFKSPNPRYAIVQTIVSTAKLQKPEAAAEAQPSLDDVQNQTPVGGARVHFSNAERRDRDSATTAASLLQETAVRALSRLRSRPSLSLLAPCPLFQEFNNHEAARLRDSLRLFEEEEPILRMRRLMNEAIADERFEVWDLVTGRLLQIRAFLLPITAIVVDPTEMKLFSGGIDC
ncbi:hypothetical protein TEA_005388 [Camellia sinensis var. sinensis]|uniref:Uncharacterized protein n=1 Tax=Camellia sinensis var. sinensis TaxID=542762 RepID=A0A4S4DLI2_CAMSN|nr:hypothetical protein TEA_005388 [Camellia sinensis var. sinensis]